MQKLKKSILPVAVLFMTLTSATYTACQETRVVQKNSDTTLIVKEELSKFENQFTAIKLESQRQILGYSNEMGCTRNSHALEIIMHYNELIMKNQERLEYHKMKVIMSGPSNTAHSAQELTELRNDYAQLLKDGVEIRKGLDYVYNSHVTQ